MAVTAALAAGALGVTPAAANSARSTVEYGDVTFVPDGDTIDVRIDGVAPDPGRNGTRIRFVGLQAMEQHTYKVDLARASGECHAVPATAQLRSILGGERDDYLHRRADGARVRLTALDSTSSSRNRELRTVSVANRRGGWDDVAVLMLRRGMALPFFNATEFVHNRAYRAAAREAAAEGIGIWDSDSCGDRPVPSARLTMHVRWDAVGDDSRHLNSEYFRITNAGDAPVPLGGWWVRDSSLRDFFRFPQGTVLKPGQKAFVHVGHGTRYLSRPGNLHFFWGQTTPVFENVTGSPTFMGDGGYLFDTVGNLRAHQIYGWS